MSSFNGEAIRKPKYSFTCNRELSTISSETLPCFKTPTGQPVFSDIARMNEMTTRDVRNLLEDAIITKVDDVLLWSNAAAYCIKNASKFKFFDALSVLDSFAKMKIYDATLIAEFSRVLLANVYKMEPRHFVQAIDAFGTFDKFPESLFTEMFYAIMRQSNKMYSNEFVDLFQCLARWNIANKRLVSHICKSLAENISFLRYTQLVQITAAAKMLQVADEPFYLILDTWQKKELAMMTFQELLDSCKATRSLDVKWQPYVDELFSEFIKQSKQLDDVGQLAEPFDCLYFLKLIDEISPEFLMSLCKWCSNAVHLPPSRSQKRPQSHELVLLYNLVKEHGIDDTYIDKAILKFVTSKGGLQLRSPKPISTVYKPNRRYIRAPDPLSPEKDSGVKFLPTQEEMQDLAQEPYNEIINEIMNELEPYPKFIDGIKFKKTSTQSCGKVSFRLKKKTCRHKNSPIIIQLRDVNNESLGSTLTVPVTLTRDQIEQLLISQLDEQGKLSRDEGIRYTFILEDSDEIKTTLLAALESAKTTYTGESILNVTYIPVSIYSIRPITRCSSSLEGHTEAVLCVEFSPDGSRLASGSGDATVRLWDLETSTPLKTLTGHTNWVQCVSWSPDGQFLASCGMDSRIIIWDPEAGSGRHLNGHSKAVVALAWQPLHHLDVSLRDYPLLASGSLDGGIRIWDCKGGHAHWVNTLTSNTHRHVKSGIYTPDFFRQRGHSASGSCISAVERVKIAKEAFEKLMQQIGCERLLTGSDDNTMFIWHPHDKHKKPTRLTGHQQVINHVAFSANGRYFASASFDRSVRIWCGITGKYLKTLRGHCGRVYRLGWSCTGSLLISASSDATLKLWDVENGKLKFDLPGHADEAYTVDWSNCGRRVASGGKDKILKIWCH
ncbi:bifunctional WD40-YVTN repeat-like-containing domain superfamily/WD40 repeat [Babesia duncani]|uniref:Bifunctional WD40-YVTN repeat-like-containing domain superfamily/WD40 repeat n=1 Tax=Babesia duncani TaxID=323732 RepID=A0AAD9PPG0_9APIC|nr:bifunctional WD40-YVTN repeat-like-containing domain superfamily/WD40 repeat [Babesia duncani]